jgi:para-aminobenzoate synthetase
VGWILACRELAGEVDAERAFGALFGSSRWAFWLDSGLLEGPARYSLLGDIGSSADPPTGRSADRRDGWAAEDAVAEGHVLIDWVSDHGTPTIYERLEQRLAAEDVELPDGLPPEVACGYVGYFGYELNAYDGLPARPAALPDAVWLRAARFVVIDHVRRRTWVCARTTPGRPTRWLDAAERTLSSLVGRPQAHRGEQLTPATEDRVDPEPWLVRSRSRYLADIETCLRALRDGECYEICLTNTVEVAFAGDPLQAYRRLRRSSPAPYAAYLRLGDAHVLSASPERFLAVDSAGYAESSPIKGTAPRDPDPGIDRMLAKELATDAKTQAENLMIVDLVRNDLGRVCDPGTITVPDFLSVRSYATVHQLVSTIRGRLRPGLSAVAAARACFPPGSMTGAPKRRAMQILHELETRPRGVYSGALGYVGLRGTADFSVVIRTAVIKDGTLTIGAGGAIVLDSDPVAEYDEMLLKAAVPLRAVSARDLPGTSGTPRPPA